jgi:hypothetical protein
MAKKEKKGDKREEEKEKEDSCNYSLLLHTPQAKLCAQCNVDHQYGV